MRGNPGTETLATWSGLDHSSDSQPIFREGIASRVPQPQRLGPDLRVGREEAHPSAAAQHTPLSKCFHPPTPSRKAPRKIPANAAHSERQLFACNRVPAKFSQVEGEKLFKNCFFL